jgi:peptidoglycan/LPS O-acetylase OafA/YrhL
MTRSTILLIDAAISLVLGLFLLVFPTRLVKLLGLPPAETFYPGILGAVVVGIAIALFLDWKRKPPGLVGLGVGGAIAIDLCAALFLAVWLLLGGVHLPVRGRIVLWAVVAVLVIVSGLGLAAKRKQEPG